METPKYKRVLLKISGEALAGDAKRGLNFEVINQVADAIKACTELGVQIGVVVGGGNFWRGKKDGGDDMVRVRADHMGMLPQPSTLWRWPMCWSGRALMSVSRRRLR